MCTAILMKNGERYFGRNLDLERGFGERLVLVPRHVPLGFRKVLHMENHFAMMGMATVVDGYPLFAEAVNEKGVAMAGLNFPQNAVFSAKSEENKDNVAPFELIPWLLGRVTDLREAREALRRLCIVHEDFREDLHVTPLHWFLCDKEEAIVVECMEDGLHVYENPIRVLTNNPPFPFQLDGLSVYQNLSTGVKTDSFSELLPQGSCSLGIGALGLPGDYSSRSRFVRASWLLQESERCSLSSEGERVGTLFSLLSTVAPIKGCVLTKEGLPHYTIYSCAANLSRGIFYLRTAEDPRICMLSLTETLCNGDRLIEPQPECACFL